MKDFLKLLQFSDDSINIYINSLGRHPLTYNELYSLVPNLSPDDFGNVVEELVNSGLLIQIQPQKPEILEYYLAIPPISPIISYYGNITTNLPNIQEQVLGYVKNSLDQIFTESNKAELNTVFDIFKEIKNDFDEDTLIQKQDADDLVKEIGNINEINKMMEQLQEKINAIAQSKFAEIIKVLTKIKIDLTDRINALELKKGKDMFLNIVEGVFKEKMQNMMGDFTTSLLEVIEEEFKNIEEPINQITQNAEQLQNDFKALYLNSLLNFEQKFKDIQDPIVKIKDNFSENIESLKNEIQKNFNSIIENTINQISGLNKPIEDGMQQSLEEIVKIDKLIVDNFWLIRSKTKVNEAILNLINNSKNEIILIIPKIENTITLEQVRNIANSVRVRIASSDPHTNSLVKQFNELTNVEFKTIQNDNIYALKGDNNHIVICILQKDSKDPLNDCIGIGVNYIPLVNLLSPIINTTWAGAKGDYGPSPRTTAPPPSTLTRTTPVRPTPMTATRVTPQVNVPPQEIPSSQPFQQPASITSSAQPKPGDQVGALINTAFNAVIQQLGNFTGKDFGKALQSVTDIILEQRGYSVTLHSVRGFVNKYKMSNNPLTENDKADIIQAIEDWKQRLL